MNDEQYEAQKARVQPLFDTWIPLLRLQAWRFRYFWERGDGPDGTANARCVMECAADWRYLHASITVYLGTVADDDDALVEEHVVHELMHVHLHELRLDDDVHNAHEERVCTQLARAFLDVRDHLTAPKE